MAGGCRGAGGPATVGELPSQVRSWNTSKGERTACVGEKARGHHLHRASGGVMPSRLLCVGKQTATPPRLAPDPSTARGGGGEPNWGNERNKEPAAGFGRSFFSCATLGDEVPKAAGEKSERPLGTPEPYRSTFFARNHPNGEERK